MEERLMKPRERAERLGTSLGPGVSPHRLAREEEQDPLNETGSDDLALGSDGVAAAQGLPGIIAVLGELKPGTIVMEEGLVQLFKRAVERGVLPC
jgi:hypothetical protein